MTERRRDGLGRRRAVLKLGQSNEHVDQKIFRIATIGISVRRDMEIRAINRTLGATDSEQLSQRLQQRRFASRVRADQGGDVRTKRNLDGLWAEAPEACERDAF